MNFNYDVEKMKGRKLFIEEYPLMIDICNTLIASLEFHQLTNTKFHSSVLAHKEKLEKEYEIMLDTTEDIV